MDLFLIRHGETVDNVAGLYAGVRDSQLTNHGVDQTKRLGEHFAKRCLFTHIFASPLSRALKTAQAIQSAQPKPASRPRQPDIFQVQELIEQNFGVYEGQHFHARIDAKKTGREAHRLQHKNDPGFVDIESKESMNSRADVFLSEHLLPLFTQNHGKQRLCVAIVSHGMLLSHLWRRLLLRLPLKSVVVESSITAARGPEVLQHLGGWSNTGYLELAISKANASAQLREDSTPDQAEDHDQPASPAATPDSADPGDLDAHELENSTSSRDRPAEPEQQQAPAAPAIEQSEAAPRLPNGWTTVILAIDRKDHLAGLKRQRGGIGRSAHDDKQGKLESFFKKQRTS